jgi:hypothetical protein
MQATAWAEAGAHTPPPSQLARVPAARPHARASAANVAGPSVGEGVGPAAQLPVGDAETWMLPTVPAKAAVQPDDTVALDEYVVQLADW